MGSVISNIDCPNCNSPECMEDYYYKTGECYAHCPDCGYHHSAWIINREKLRSGEDKSPEWKEEQTKNPYCAFYVDYSKTGTAGTFSTEEEFLKAKKEILEKKDEIKKFSISRFVDGQIKKQIIFEQKKLIKEFKTKEEYPDYPF